MISQPITTINGVIDCAGPLEKNAAVSACNGNMYLSYSANDQKMVAGQQDWLLAPYKNAVPSANSNLLLNLLNDPRISGWVWTTDWRTLETSQGVYNFTSMLNRLANLASIGKKMIIRIYVKTYSGTLANTPGSPPTPLAIPDYVVNDPTTYGTGVTGDPTFRGGLYPVYLSAGQVGWGAYFENPNVMARYKALEAAMGAAIAAAPAASQAAFAGIMGPDESTRSAYNGSGLAVGMTADSIISANLEIYRNQLTVFSDPLKVWPVVNIVDGTSSTIINNSRAHQLQAAVAAMGMNIAVSDTFPIPKTMTQFLQPVYQTTPRTDLSISGQNPTGGTGAKILAHCDNLSALAAYNASTADQIMYDNAIQMNRLGAHIRAWNPLTFDAGGFGNASWWASIQRAIDASRALGVRS